MTEQTRQENGKIFQEKKRNLRPTYRIVGKCFVIFYFNSAIKHDFACEGVRGESVFFLLCPEDSLTPSRPGRFQIVKNFPHENGSKYVEPFFRWVIPQGFWQTVFGGNFRRKLKNEKFSLSPLRSRQWLWGSGSQVKQQRKWRGSVRNFFRSLSLCLWSRSRMLIRWVLQM